MITARPSSILSLAFAAVLLCCVLAMAQTQSPLPSPTGYVNDYAGVIDRQTKDSMEVTLTNLDREQEIQFAVVTVDSTNGVDIFQYSLAVARGWGIGAKDTSKPGLLLLVAINDRKYFTQVSRHLEGDLPDGLVGQIQREQLVPAFRAGEYGKGLANTINAYITEVAAKRGFSTDKIFAPGSTEPSPPDRSGKGNLCLSAPVILAIAVFIFFVLARIGRRGGRGGFGGGGGGWLGWLLLSTLMNSGRDSHSSGWSGGGFGGFGGGGSGGGGGFGGFGGGGDFGGGGSGGSW
jgi:uncharacterized protein